MKQLNIPDGYFLVICALMVFIGYKWGKSATLKKYCCYGSCSGGNQCDCHAISPANRIQ